MKHIWWLRVACQWLRACWQQKMLAVPVLIAGPVPPPTLIPVWPETRHRSCPRPCAWEPVISAITVTRREFTIGQASPQLLNLFQLLLLQCIHQISGHGKHWEGQVEGRSARFLKYDIQLSEQKENVVMLLCLQLKKEFSCCTNEKCYFNVSASALFMLLQHTSF